MRTSFAFTFALFLYLIASALFWALFLTGGTIR